MEKVSGGFGGIVCCCRGLLRDGCAADNGGAEQAGEDRRMNPRCVV
ncbi:MAG: hypothetical protein KUG82_11470 [Pseudomonadales bacterium]|nr:hypothetical protein [Pseudomonadales bacterium]